MNTGANGERNGQLDFILFCFASCRDVDDEANSHKSTFLIRLNADGHAGELEKASSSETVKLPGEDEPCSFDTTPTLDAGGAFQTAIPNDPYCSCEGSVDGRRTVSCSEISPQSDSRQIVEGFGNHPGLEEDSLQVARLRLQNLQKQLDYLSELQSHLAHTSEGLRDALSSLHQEHSSRQSDLTVS